MSPIKSKSVIKRLGVSFSPIWVLIGIGIMDFGIFIYGNSLWKSNLQKTTPLLDNVARAKVNVSSGHLWFEEMIGGDQSITMEFVLGLLYGALDMLDDALEGKSNMEGIEGKAVTDIKLINEIKHVKTLIYKFIDIGKERYKTMDVSGIGSEIDQRFDDVFREVLANVDVIDKLVHFQISDCLRRMRLIQMIILISWGIVVSGAGGMLFVTNRKRKQLEGSLASEKEHLSVTLHSIGDGVIATNNRGDVVILNKVAQELTGWIQEEASGRPLTEVFHIINEKTREIMENPVEKVLKDGKIVGLGNDTALIARDGTERIIADSAAPILDRENNIIGVVLVFRDITERKQLEEERQNMRLKMMQRSKLASLGEIATGIAHEINQPLTYINSFIYRLQRKLEEDTIDKDVVKDEAETSRGQIYRITNIINHLRTFGRADDMEKRQVSIETILNNTLLLMGEQMRFKNIKMKKDIKPDLPMISGSPTQLEQVFINLFQNAIDAFPEKPKNAEIRVGISLFKDKGSIVIEVADNGMGIEKENIDKIFEPFFTTKEVGKGTGLGLSIVYGIIREHNGTISCESEVGKGSAFTVMLPVA